MSYIRRPGRVLDVLLRAFYSGPDLRSGYNVYFPVYRQACRITPSATISATHSRQVIKRA